MALKSWLAWTALLGFCGLARSRHINSYAGPNIIFVSRGESCPSDGSLVINFKTTHFNPAKPFERQWMLLHVNLTTPYDDSYWVHFAMATRSNNAWKENALVFDFPGGACSALREHLPSFFHILSTFQPELRNKRTPCKFKPGQYHFENQTVDWEAPHFKVLPYGHYRLTVTGGKGSRLIKECLTVECDVIPKPS